MTRRPRPFLDVVEEHLDDLEFLLELREGLTHASDWDLRELERLEARLEAHLDGLRLAGDMAVELGLAALESDQPARVAAGALVLLEHGSAGGLDSALAELSPDDLRDGARIALRHCRALGPTEGLLRTWLQSTDVPRAAVAADVLTFRRSGVDVPIELLDASGPETAALIWGALGRGSCVRSPALVRRGLADEGPTIRAVVLAAAAHSGADGLLEVVRAAATRRDPDPVCMAWLGVLGEAADEQPLLRALAGPLANEAARALGALGRPSSVGALLEATRTPARAEAAYTALQRMTGLDGLRHERPTLDLDAPEPDEDPGPPAPDPEALAKWWTAHRRRLEGFERMQYGRPAPVSIAEPAAEEVPLAIRADAYIADRARRAVPLDVELSALVRVQRQHLMRR